MRCERYRIDITDCSRLFSTPLVNCQECIKNLQKGKTHTQTGGAQKTSSEMGSTAIKNVSNRVYLMSIKGSVPHLGEQGSAHGKGPKAA